MRHDLGVHQVVALAFLGPVPEGMEVAHNDGNPANPLPGNLRYDTPQGNTDDKRRHGTWQFGETHPMSRLTEAKVRAIRRMRALGDTWTVIAVWAGESVPTVTAAGNRHTWRHVV